MHKIKILDIGQENQILNKNFKPNKIKKKKEIIVKINDNLFKIGLRKDLIEKNDGEYYFIGGYEEFLAFKNQEPSWIFELLD